jgi:hypothetical protein
LLFPLVAFAQEAGAAEVALVTMMLTGPLGFALGLGVVTLGIWQFVLQNNAAAIMLVIAGVLITLAPGIYNGAHAVVCPIMSALGSSKTC